MCKACKGISCRARYVSNQDVRKKQCESASAWRQQHPLRARETRLEWRARQRKNLTDQYITKLLTERGWPKASITAELLALKREQLQAMRLAGEVHDVLKDYAPAQQVEERRPPTAEEIEHDRLERNARFRARYAANVDKERARIAAYKAAHPEKVAAQRERAKQRKQQQNNATPAGALAGNSQRDTA